MPEINDPALLARLNAGAPQGARPIGGPDPRIPLAVAKDQQSLVRGQQDIQAAPLDRTGKLLGNQKTAQSIGFDRLGAMSDLQKRFNEDKRVVGYRDTLQAVVGAMTAPDTAQGDLAVIYSFAKAMDPGSAVRGEEMDMARGTSPLMGQLQSYVGIVNSGKRLPPATRKGLVNAMRERGAAHNAAYSEARKQYGVLAKEGGFDPDELLGQHDGLKYQQAEANFKGEPVKNLDGSMGAAPKGFDPNRWATVTDQEIRDHLVKYQSLPLEDIQFLAQRDLGRNIDNLPAVMEQLKADGRLPGIVNRSEEGNAELMGLLKGGKHVWDRAAQGLQNGVNAATGSNFQSADRASAVSDEYFKQQPTNNLFETFGKIGAAGLMTAPFGGPVVQGALSGPLMTDSNTLGGVATDAVVGGIGGKIGDKLLKGSARLLGAEIDPAAKRLAQEGAKLTPGRIFPSLRMAEDLGDTLPFAGPKIRAAQEQTLESINRIPANRSLAPIGQSLPDDVPAGHEAVAYTQNKLSDFYNQALAGKDVALDPTFVTRLNAIGQRAGLRPQEVNDLGEVVQRELGGAFQTGPELGKMSGRTFKRTDERLSNIASAFGRNDQDPFKQQEGQVLGDIVDQFKALARRQSPEMAKDLRAADEGWANFVRYRAAAKASPATGLASPGQFRTAASQMDKSVGKGATARGEALMQDFASDASKIIPSDFGNSGTSPREAFSQFRPWAFAKGAALAPLWSDMSVEALNKLAKREAGPLSKAGAKALRALPAGPLGGLIPWLINPGQQ